MSVRTISPLDGIRISVIFSFSLPARATVSRRRSVPLYNRKKLLKEVSLFDVYEGKNLEAGKKSYAVSFLLQDENATLNDKQIDKIMSKLVKNLEDKLNAKLR